MKILGRDCGCDERARVSGVTNPLRYWLWYRPLRAARRALYGLLALRAELRPLMRTLRNSEHLMMAEGHLMARVVRATGEVEEYDLGYNTITDAAVAYLVDDFDNGGQDVSTFNFHAWGTGACGGVPPACGATGLVTAASEARVAGTRSQPAANQFRTVGTITADGTKTITEWGLASAAAAGTFWSLRCFSGSSVAVVLGDAIEFTYTVTFDCVSG